jgi:hypothetical protein
MSVYLSIVLLSKNPAMSEVEIGWKMKNPFLRKADLEKTIIKKTGGRLQAANKTTYCCHLLLLN